MGRLLHHRLSVGSWTDKYAASYLSTRNVLVNIPWRPASRERDFDMLFEFCSAIVLKPPLNASWCRGGDSSRLAIEINLKAPWSAPFSLKS